jgi:hypothetical protein
MSCIITIVSLLRKTHVTNMCTILSVNTNLLFLHSVRKISLIFRFASSVEVLYSHFPESKSNLVDYNN